MKETRRNDSKQIIGIFKNNTFDILHKRSQAVHLGKRMTPLLTENANINIIKKDYCT